MTGVTASATGSLGTAAWIAALGALGSLLRWSTGLLLARLGVGAALAPTLTVNVLGSFAMGLVMALWSTSPRGVALSVGLLGGFTTYSAFAYGTVALLERRAWGTAAGYVLATLLGAAAACAAGLALGRALR